METHRAGVWGRELAADQFQFRCKVIPGGRSCGPDVFALQLDRAGQVELGQDGAGHPGPEGEQWHFGFSVFVVRCQQQELLGQVEVHRSGCFSVHTAMVDLPGRRSNGLSYLSAPTKHAAGGWV